jgi:hypothetical protein
MDYYPEWVGGDGPPVVVNMGRPGRHRGRLGSEHHVGRQRAYYTGPNGELLVPASGAAYRSNSVSGPRPQVNIINETSYEEGGRRPRSIHYDDYYGRSRSHSRSPVPEYDLDTRDKLRRLKHLEKKDEEEKLAKEMKEKLLLEKAKEEVEAKEKKQKEKEMKKKAVEEWKAEEREKKEKEKEEKEQADKEYKERMRRTLWANGYTDEQIEQIVKRGDKREKGEKGEKAESSGILSLSRPTYLRIKRKYLDPQTLDLYQLPWEWDDDDNSYVIVKKWINERDQEILFEHTRKLREMKQLTYTTTELRKEHDQLLLVKRREPRKKSPARGWFFT